jgi:hypothetical protein
MKKSIIIIAMSIIFISCKKEKSDSNKDIIYKTLNFTLNNSDTLLNITGQSLDEFKISASNDTDYAYYGFYLYSFSYDVNFHTISTTINDLKPLSSGVEINSSLTTWNYRSDGYFNNNTGGLLGVITPGSGDKYIGLRIAMSDGDHYGWLLLNYTSDKKLIIKEAAYNKVVNGSIKAGQK